MKRTEDIMLAECHMWLWNTYPETRYCAWHIANERLINPVVAAQLRSKGVVKGVGDYVFNWHYNTTYFEFKSEGGKLSEAQIFWINAMRNQGFTCVIIQSTEQFQRIIHEILILHIVLNAGNILT